MKTTREKMKNDPQSLRDAVGERFRIFARRKHPRNTPRRTAEDAGCSYHTGKAWFDKGQCPGTAHLLRLMHVWGPSFIAFILDPIDKDLARIAELKVEVQEIQKRMHRVHEALDKHGKHNSKD